MDSNPRSPVRRTYAYTEIATDGEHRHRGVIYEESQRHPGDYETQVSQRPIAIHGLEHLGATDRGVTMFRNQIRRGIRAVKAGDEPHGLCHHAGAIVPTYCNDTIVHASPAETAIRNRQLRRETGRRLAEAYLKNPPLMTGR